MIQRDDDTQRLLAVLTRCRSECLTHYTSQIYAQGSPFTQDDRLITQVRGGTFYDALCAYIHDGSSTTFTTFIEGMTYQLINGGYNYDHIKRMYNLLGQNIMTVVRREFVGEPGFDAVIRTLNFGLQLVQVVTLTQSSAQLFQRMNLPVPADARVASPPRPTPPPYVRPRTPNGTTNFLTVLGYLAWPFEPIAKSHPPEYVAQLEDGTHLNVLLVDDPSAYVIRGQMFNAGVRCNIRRIGPIALAYPL